MAVIQDLPPELLERILDLLASPTDIGTNELRWKRNLALVCRDWAEPGQRALLHRVLFSASRYLKSFVSAIDQRRRRTSAPIRVDELALGGFLTLDDHETVRNLLEAGKMQVMVLSASPKLDVSAHALERGGVQSLVTSFCYNLNFQASSSEGFRRLHKLVINESGQPLRVPSSISRFAIALWAGPTLTHLNITIYDSAEPEAIVNGIDILRLTAPFLRHLTLRIDFQRSEDATPIFPLLKEAVSHLKALPYLSIGSSHLSTLLPLLDHLPSSLRVLRLDTMIELFEPVKLTTWCLKALDLPCLRELKRWRVSPLLGVDTTKGEGARWAAMCEERGIEVRDNKRYFSD